jgi:hypothetical protein
MGMEDGAMTEDVEGLSGLFGISAEALGALLAGPPDPLDDLYAVGLRTVAESEAARDGYLNLVSKAMQAPGLAGLLRMIEVAVTVEPQLREHWVGEAVPSGMTRKQLRNLSGRLIRVADEIGRVNKAAWYSPEMWLTKVQEDREQELRRRWTLREFNILPGVLRFYAAYLEGRRGSVGRFRRGQGRKPPFLDQCVELLVLVVRQTTKRPHWREIADILGALGVRGDNPFDENSLRMWHKTVSSRRMAIKQLGS